MLFDTDFEDEVTVIEVRDELEAAFEPPPLPFPLVSKKDTPSGETGLEDLEELEFRALASGILG